MIAPPAPHGLWERGKQVRGRFGISPATLWRWTKRGVIQSKKIEGVVLFNVGAFIDALESKEEAATK